MITAPSLCLSGETGETGWPTMGALTGSETTAAETALPGPPLREVSSLRFGSLCASVLRLARLWKSTVRVCLCLSGRQVGYPPPRRRLPRVSHRGRLQAQTSRGAKQAQQWGAFSIAGVCKDEQAERGDKRRHMTKGQRAMVAAKILFLRNKYSQRESAPKARPANFLRRSKRAKVDSLKRTPRPTQVVFRKPRFMLNPSLRSLNINR